MGNRPSGTRFVSVVLAGLAVFAGMPATRAQTAEKQWKDRAEYDIYTAARTERDGGKRLSLLDQWRQNYPATSYMDERLQLYLVTYQELGKPDRMVNTAREMLGRDPDHLQGLATVVAMTPNVNDTASEALDLGERAARRVLQLDRPPSMADTEWNNLKAAAHKTLGWTAMVRQNHEVAEQEFKRSLAIQGRDAVQSYWLGLVLVAQKRAEKQSEALFHFARGASYEGPGALSAQGRRDVDAYLAKAYDRYHGADPQGLADLKTAAMADALPKEGFRIESAEEAAVRKQNQLQQENPQLALWMGIKRQLLEGGGDDYFVAHMKGTAFPKLRGVLISTKPALRPKELVLGITDGAMPEVTLVMDAPLRGKADPGTVLEFDGVPSNFSKEPFMVFFQVGNEGLHGWPAEASPARKTRDGVRTRRDSRE